MHHNFWINSSLCCLTKNTHAAAACDHSHEFTSISRTLWITRGQFLISCCCVRAAVSKSFPSVIKRRQCGRSCHGEVAEGVCQVPCPQCLHELRLRQRVLEPWDCQTAINAAGLKWSIILTSFKLHALNRRINIFGLRGGKKNLNLPPVHTVRHDIVDLLVPAISRIIIYILCRISDKFPLKSDSYIWHLWEFWETSLEFKVKLCESQ